MVDLYSTRISPKGKTLPSIADRFWKKVDKDGPIPEHVPEIGKCWNWLGTKSGEPKYGHIELIPIGNVGAHRLSWMIHNGDIPDGLLVCHKCDNEICVRPDHLFLGTDADNNRDMMNKGRHGKHDESIYGINSTNVKLTEEQVIEVRRLSIEGLRISEIAERTSVTHSNISNIRSGRKWRFLPTLLNEMLQAKSLGRFHHVSRGLHGSKNPMAKLTEEKVRLIRNRLALGVSQKSVAEEFCVSHGLIWLISSGKIWKNV
jgi:hypothetical protein